MNTKKKKETNTRPSTMKKAYGIEEFTEEKPNLEPGEVKMAKSHPGSDPK